MKSTIFYFSGTGNSLDIARKIGEAIEPQAELVSIVKQYNNDVIKTDADVVGFVFPIYMGDAPWVVKEFVKRLAFSGGPYIFAVATCNDKPRNCLPIFRALIETRSETLALAEMIPMPGNAKISSPETNAKRLKISAKRCAQVAQKINNRTKEESATAMHLSKKTVLGSPRKKLNIAFTRFKVSSACNACGACQRICPMGNVMLGEGKPLWGEACAACLACFHWCPQKAITFRLPFLGNRLRYHHPDVTIKDIAAQQPSGSAGKGNLI